jgi:hypothetical protein
MDLEFDRSSLGVAWQKFRSRNDSPANGKEILLPFAGQVG